MHPHPAAVVTGGGVVVCDQDRASATATTDLVAADGGAARSVRADVTVDEQVRRVLDGGSTLA